MSSFDYAAATTLDEAVSLLAAQGDRAKILAGGTDVLVQLRETDLEADLVLDIKRIPELMELRVSPTEGLWLGAGVPCNQLTRNQDVVRLYPAVVDAARILGGWQIQARASIGGNLCNSSPAADAIPALIAYDAVCHVAGPEGSRTVPVAEFCTAPGRNVLSRGELLVAIELPPQPPTSGAHYRRFIPRNEMDIAVVGVGAWLELAGETIKTARIALGAVAPTPVLAREAGEWLAGKPATEESFAEAGRLAQAAASPISDMRAPAEYRKHLVGVLTRRVLAMAASRASA